MRSSVLCLKCSELQLRNATHNFSSDKIWNTIQVNDRQLLQTKRLQKLASSFKTFEFCMKYFGEYKVSRNLLINEFLFDLDNLETK